VVYWPVSAGLKGGEEWHFLKWAKYQNNYHPQVKDTVSNEMPKGYHRLRYQTKTYDHFANSQTFFTEVERFFLERYRSLRHVSEFFKPEDLFCVTNKDAAQNEIEKSYESSKLKMKNFDVQRVAYCTHWFLM
jgi:hypothetical protein